MARALVLVLMSVALALVAGERASYENYRVYKVTPQLESSIAVLSKLEGSSDSLIFLDGIHTLGKSVNVVVAPHKLPDFVNTLTVNGIEYELVETNVESKLNELSRDVAHSRSGQYDWTSYHELDETYAWLASLAEKYPNEVRLVEGGRTYEGRKILGVKISKKSGNKGIFIEGGIHAREWISPATVTYITNQLLTSNDTRIKEIAENYDWYLFPHTNPDGFVYTHTTNRLWRKTRSPQGNGCFGVDANRNWDFHWLEVGASDTPCSDTFAGPTAFSEIETKSLSDYIKSLKGKINLYISFHSYSQLLLFPYGHTKELPSNYKDLKKIFDVTIAELNKRYGTVYKGGNIYDAIYPASGASVDWVYGKQNVKLSYCYELRPSSNAIWTGFQLPAAQIIPTGEETLDSMVAMIREAKRLTYL